MRDVYGVLRHVGIFPSDNSDEGSVSPNSCPSVSRPSALSSGFSHLWVRVEEKGKSNLEKWFGLVQFSVGQPDNKLGRP